MTLSAHQVSYLPWLGYFHKMAHCDLFVVLDDVPLSGVDKDNWVNRCVIAGPGGQTILTVPVRRKHGVVIRDIAIDGERWVQKHRKALVQTYPKWSCLSRLPKPWMYLSDVHESTLLLANTLGVGKAWTWQSRHPTPGLAGEDMLLALCKHFNADRFLFGRNGRDYVTPEKWRAAGIEPVYQDFKVPEYDRRGPPATRILSIVDAIANVGLEQTRDIIERRT